MWTSNQPNRCPSKILHILSTFPNILTKKIIHVVRIFSYLCLHGYIFTPNWTHSFIQGDGESSAARAAEARRRAAARRKAKSQQIKSSHLKLGTPPPIQGRKHERIQTENYLEEIFVTPPVSEMCTQTDLFLERPVSPFYIPAKTGADAATQIYPGDVSKWINNDSLWILWFNSFQLKLTNSVNRKTSFFTVFFCFHALYIWESLIYQNKI